ncbi:MAG: MG2 domain-containing protein, partial [Syntrophobacteraceae bacterium]
MEVLMTMCRFGLSLPKRCRRGVIPASVVIFTLVWLCVACAFTGVAGASPDEVLKINRITPSGPDVPAGRQIVFEFDRPVVPLGKMGRAASEVPVVIEPALSCQWRWLSPSTLACQLGEQNAMVPATSYKVTVEPGIRAEDGTALTKRVVHGFTTRRPRITSCDFQQWVSPVLPRFRVHLNQPVHKASLEQHLFFQMEGGGRVAPKVVEDTKYSKTAPRGTIWLVSPSADLPLDKAGALVVEPGISSTLGKEPGSEKRKAAEFQTMPAFRFLGIQCRNLAGAELILAPGKTVSSQSRCNPQGAISLLFSSPVMQSELQNKVKILKGSKGIEAGPEIWMDSDYSKLGDTRLKGQKYESFLESDNIAAFSEYRLQAKVNSIKDEFGRPLATPIDMSFATDHRPPDLTIYRNMSALEKGLETDLPMFATNIDQIEIKYQALTSQGRSSAKTEVLPGPKARDVVVTVPLGSRKLLRAPSGILTGAIATRPHLPEREYQPRWFIAQITPFHVHVKLGHFNTVVWVTDLQTGEPVPGVEVSLRKDIMKDLGGSPEVLSTARTGPDGVAELEGSANADPTLTLLQSAYNRDGPMLFVSCQKEGDLALVPLHYEFQVDSEASNHRYIPSWSRARHGHMRSWGATAQGIYKVGDTVQYKIYVRDQENRRFVRPPADTYILKVLDPTSKIIHQRDNIKLSEFGAFDGEFPIPKNGAVGYYSFQLGGTLTKNQMEPLQVLVSDFTPSPFKVITELNGGMFGTGDAVEVTTQARMHSGGPFGRARTRITASVERMPFTPASPLARGFEFDVIKTDDDETTTPGGTQTVFQTQAGLDDGGNLVSRFSVAETPVLYGRLSVESSVQDDRGKSVAGRAVATYFGRDRFVGLFQEDWLIQEGRPAKAKLIVVDQDGNAVPEAPVHVTIERLQTMAARVRGAGDAYPSQYEKEWIPVQELDLSSGEQPVEFEFTPDKSGTIRITAKVVDTKERPQETALNRWVVGKGHVLWETREGSLLNMYAEKEEYRVGDTVKLLVQNPFPGASAMITVERYGTLDRWVRKFESSTEVVEIPVQPDYLPGFYVSVMVMSPRVEKPLGPAGEDLGKPAFRMGYAKIEVKDQYKEIAVQCKPDREVYKPGETVEIDFEARPKNIVPGEKPVPIEIAVAVLDEAVFDLLKQKKQAFDPYRGFYHLEDLDLQNYNLLMQLIGREKLEKKGASPAAAAGFDLS